MQKILIFAVLLAVTMQAKTFASNNANATDFEIPGKSYKQSYQTDKLNRNK